MHTPDDASPPPPSQGRHLATISHAGRFWDVYVELQDDPGRYDTCRARLCFSPSDLNEGEQPARTAPIIIEHSPEEAVRKAMSFEDHHLVGLLRSALPGEDGSATSPADPDASG